MKGEKNKAKGERNLLQGENDRLQGKNKRFWEGRRRKKSSNEWEKKRNLEEEKKVSRVGKNGGLKTHCSRVRKKGNPCGIRRKSPPSPRLALLYGRLITGLPSPSCLFQRGGQEGGDLSLNKP